MQAHLRQAPTDVDLEALVATIVEKVRDSVAAAPVQIPEDELQEAEVLLDEVAMRSSSSSTERVRNDVSGMVHAAASDSVAKCGWHFARRPHTRVASDAPMPPGAACSNCFFGGP